MALFKIEKGLAVDLATKRPNTTEGYCYVTTDDGKFYIDTATGNGTDKRIVLNAGTADKLKNKITFTSSGEEIGSFDGSSAATIEIGSALEEEFLPLTGGTLTGDLNLQSNLILTENVSYGNSLPEDVNEGTIFFMPDDNYYVPDGGTEGQILIKNSNVDGDVAWNDIDDIIKNNSYNPNLLDNWYFGKPVNQKGQTSYTTSNQYIIDRWKIEHYINVFVNNGSINLSKLSEGSAWFKQFLRTNLLGKEVTSSILMLDGTLFTFTTVVPEDSSSFSRIIGNAHFGIRFNTVTSCTEWGIFFNTADVNSLDIVAVKFELGNTQTLAHQDSNGNWILNEIPKYSEELLKCRQYDPYTGEYIGLRKFSQPRNLLDNSDFSNPVNQRGLTECINGYPIDRWHTASNINGYTYIRDGYIEITAPNSTGIHEYTDFYQNFASGDTMTGKTYTMAANIDGNVYCTSFTFRNQGGGIRLTDNVVFYSVSDLEYLIRIYDTTKLYWAALYEGEYTIDTLPEYTPKGYAAELAECMRYYQKHYTQAGPTFSSSDHRYYSLNFYMPMRIKPSITLLTCTEYKSWTELNAVFSFSMVSNSFVRIQAAVNTTPNQDIWAGLNFEASADL